MNFAHFGGTVTWTNFSCPYIVAEYFTETHVYSPTLWGEPVDEVSELCRTLANRVQCLLLWGRGAVAHIMVHTVLRFPSRILPILGAVTWTNSHPFTHILPNFNANSQPERGVGEKPGWSGTATHRSTWACTNTCMYKYMCMCVYRYTHTHKHGAICRRRRVCTMLLHTYTST